ncbi:MAG: hypothetical protein PHH47_11205 [Gallionella sp.]|nr:hypothetical protein [Gallionella sp.]MDD4947008.1 hypothetical protein [Gallionella sp.]
MGFWSSVASVVSSAVSAVSSAASAAWNTAKAVAGKAIGWMAEKAEGFVDGVKKVWAAVEPHVGKIQAFLRSVAATVPIPWVKAVCLALDRGIGALTTFANSPIAKKIDAAIKWGIEIAKRWQQTEKKRDVDQEELDRLNEEELKEAKRHQETFRFSERESASEDERHKLGLMAAINDYEIAKTELANTIDAKPADFVHFLRLRATQKLLAMADKQFRAAKTIEDLSADDLFLVRIASDLIKEAPELSNEAAQRLDRLLTERYGKKLAPFVYEELIASWAKRAEVLENQWEAENRAYAKDSMLLKRLCIAKDIQAELDPNELAELTRLETSVPEQKKICDELATKQHDLERYVGAAEGLLQSLEKSEDQLIADGHEYLIKEGCDVGRVLTDCAEHDRAFSELELNEQELITDYSNIFKKDSKARMQSILEVTA